MADSLRLLRLWNAIGFALVLFVVYQYSTASRSR